MTDVHIASIADQFGDICEIEATDLGKVSIVADGEMLYTRKQARQLVKAIKKAIVVAEAIAE